MPRALGKVVVSSVRLSSWSSSDAAGASLAAEVFGGGVVEPAQVLGPRRPPAMPCSRPWDRPARRRRGRTAPRIHLSSAFAQATTSDPPTRYAHPGRRRAYDVLHRRTLGHGGLRRVQGQPSSAAGTSLASSSSGRVIVEQIMESYPHPPRQVCRQPRMHRSRQPDQPSQMGSNRDSFALGRNLEVISIK